MPIEPLTINRPIPFGYHRDGTYAAAEMRQKCVAIVGTPGSGKTVVEQCFVAGLVRCPDALVWPIDLSSGGLTNPWLNPWLDGDMATPVLDWCAFTRDEAVIMTRVALEIIAARRLAYRRHMRRADTDIVPCSPDIPAIYILLDEGKEATGVRGNPELISNLITIADKGRAVAVRIIITGLRATSETIPKEMMADIGARVGMKVAEENELAHLLGWKVKFNARDYPYPGCGLWRDDLAGAPQRFRSFDLSKPSSIERIALACEPWRPVLDEPSAAVPSGHLYETRWDRALPILQGSLHDGGPMSPGSGGPGSPVGPAARVSPVPPAAHRSEPQARAGSPGPAHPTGRLDLAGLDAKIAKARRMIHLDKAAAPRHVDAEWERLAAQLGDDRAAGGEGWADARPDGGRPDARTRVGQIVAEFQPGGISAPKILAALRAEGYDTGRSTVYEWLNADCVDGGYGAWHPKPGSDR